VYRFKRAGRFSDALAAFEGTKAAQTPGHAAEILRVELLEAIGQHRRATNLAASLLKTRHLQLVEKKCLRIHPRKGRC
jgi:hypothetical protein